MFYLKYFSNFSHFVLRITDNNAPQQCIGTTAARLRLEASWKNGPLFHRLFIWLFRVGNKTTNELWVSRMHLRLCQGQPSAYIPPTTPAHAFTCSCSHSLVNIPVCVSTENAERTKTRSSHPLPRPRQQEAPYGRMGRQTHKQPVVTLYGSHDHQYPPTVSSYNVNVFGKEKFSRPALAFLLSMRDKAVRQTDWQEMEKRLKTNSPAFYVAKGRAWVWLSLLKNHICRDECGIESRSSGSRGLCWWRGWHVTHVYWKSSISR